MNNNQMRRRRQAISASRARRTGGVYVARRRDFGTSKRNSVSLMLLKSFVWVSI